jgi:haloacetate dehalogenase
MFDGFATRELQTERGPIHARVGGSGPPLLLLHGYPQTHLMWHSAAPLLAERFTVVATDLSGYGQSLRPTPAADHAPHSKRALAVDQVQAMASLGYERFAVAGHDRGGRVAYRMALDHPDRVAAVAVLDIVPTAEVWARADDRFALAYWHWGFLAQPAPLPERLIASDPDAYFDYHLRSIGLDGAPGRYPEPVVEAYRAQLDDETAVEAICEDYRAGASIDRELDEADRGRQIECPVLALWGTHGALEAFYGDVLAVWRPWARDLRGHGIEASHFLVEDRPEEVARELQAFFEGAGGSSDRA